jgi:hypothetical protein
MCEKELQGEQGPQGEQGIQGIPSPQGEQGLPGADSIVAGPQGIQGIQGIPGSSLCPVFLFFEIIFLPDWGFWGRKTLQRISARTMANPIMNSIHAMFNLPQY